MFHHQRKHVGCSGNPRVPSSRYDGSRSAIFREPMCLCFLTLPDATMEANRVSQLRDVRKHREVVTEAQACAPPVSDGGASGRHPCRLSRPLPSGARCARCMQRGCFETSLAFASIFVWLCRIPVVWLVLRRASSSKAEMRHLSCSSLLGLPYTDLATASFVPGEPMAVPTSANSCRAYSFKSC